ncbi:MAG: TIGR03013 family PEP-CTERM/XrtA system glycosyltransferase [Rhodoferax sp.]|nr:TIGR03013 family PEP-CTERM/XrtA system glycosyltransferase [Rhodoferax sp.]
MIRIFNHYLHRQTLLRVLSDLGFILVAMLVVFFTQTGSLESVLPVAGPQLVSLAAGMFLINGASGLYQKAPNFTMPQVVARAALALLLALPLTWLLFGLLPVDFEQRNAVRLAAMVGVGIVTLRRVYATAWSSSHTRTRILVLGCGPAAQLVTNTLRESDPHALVVGYYPSPNETECAVDRNMVLSAERSLSATAEELGADEIVVALTERRSGAMPLRELLDCKLVGVKVHDINTHFEKTLGQIRLGFANAGWMIFGDGFDQGFGRSAVKRVFDILTALLLIVLSAPIMLVAAIVIKLDSRGPVFYRQERLGQDGKPFMVTKFRSMRTDAEKDGKPRWATVHDDRVTRVGNFIRKTRIDELPQLFNVLKGEMSMVGPRPERAYFVEQLTQQIPFFAVRHSVKPGVTGWAQVRYQYGATVEDSIEKLQYDLYYVKNHSLFLDLMILFETVAVVLTGKGAR